MLHVEQFSASFLGWLSVLSCRTLGSVCKLSYVMRVSEQKSIQFVDVCARKQFASEHIGFVSCPSSKLYAIEFLLLSKDVYVYIVNISRMSRSVLARSQKMLGSTCCHAAVPTQYIKFKSNIHTYIFIYIICIHIYIYIYPC